MEPHKPKIGILTSSIMLAVVVFIELIQLFISLLVFLPTIITQVLVLVIAVPLSILAYVTYFFWFAFLGVSFINMKKPLSSLAKSLGVILESLPVFSALPALGLSVLFTLVEANGPKHFPASILPKWILSPALLKKGLQVANDNKKERGAELDKAA